MEARRSRRAARIASAISATLLLVNATARADAPKSGGTGSGGSQLATPASAPATADRGEEASIRFKRGLQLFDDGDYTLALVEFERAYQLAPNYRALYNIGLVDIQLARYADAVHTFEAYLRDGGDQVGSARKLEVTKKLSELRLRTATVDIGVNAAGAEVTLDGKPVDPSRLGGPMLIDAGEHALRATAPSYAPKDRTITLAGGDHVAVRFDLVSLAPAPRPEEPTVRRRPIFWPGFAATGGLAAGAAVSGILMLNARSRLDTLQNTPGSSQAQRETYASRTNTTALVADIFTGLAVVTGGISLYLSLSPDRSPKATGVALSGRGVAMVGSF
jgi:hypothetical protein